MIDIPPEVNRINTQLIDHFGIDTSTGQPIWRVSWTDDQYEKRKTDITSEGLQLLYPEIRELPKYSYLPHKWVLEQLTVVPEVNREELAGLKLSYEPIFPFQTESGDALPPSFEASKWVIDTIYASKGKKSLRKYVENSDESKKRVEKLKEELFGNENDITDALAYGEGVGYTGPSKMEES